MKDAAYLAQPDLRGHPDDQDGLELQVYRACPETPDGHRCSPASPSRHHHASHAQLDHLECAEALDHQAHQDHPDARESATEHREWGHLDRKDPPDHLETPERLELLVHQDEEPSPHLVKASPDRWDHLDLQDRLDPMDDQEALVEPVSRVFFAASH